MERLFETRLAPFLSQKAFNFWNTRMWYFKDGLYYQGGMVRHAVLISSCVPREPTHQYCGGHHVELGACVLPESGLEDDRLGADRNCLFQLSAVLQGKLCWVLQCLGMLVGVTGSMRRLANAPTLQVIPMTFQGSLTVS